MVRLEIFDLLPSRVYVVPEVPHLVEKSVSIEGNVPFSMRRIEK